MKKNSWAGAGWTHRAPFRQLPAAVQQELSRQGIISQHPKGTVLFREGEPAEALWVLRHGWVQIVRRTTDGRTFTLDVVTPKDGVFGLSAFSGDLYGGSAVAASPVTVAQVPAQTVRALWALHPPFASGIVDLLSRRFEHMAQAYATAFAPVEQRVGSVLLRLEEDFGTTIPLTRREVAALAGTTVETAIRTMSRFEQNGWVHSTRGKIQLVKPEGLRWRLP